MTQSIPLETYKALEKEFGQAVAEKVTSLLEYSFTQSEKKVEQIALQKKLEVKDELSKELASKSDLAVLEQKLDKKITVWSVVIIAVVIITNANTLQYFAQMLGLIR